VNRKISGVILLAVFVSFFPGWSDKSSKREPKQEPRQDSVQREEAIDFTLTGFDNVG